jgi:hypothetical protein
MAYAPLRPSDPYYALPATIWHDLTAIEGYGYPIEDLQVACFDHWLKGKDNGLDQAPPVRVFVVGLTVGAMRPTGRSREPSLRPTTCTRWGKRTQWAATAE